MSKDVIHSEGRGEKSRSTPSAAIEQIKVDPAPAPKPPASAAARARKKRRPKSEPPLLFIDTNILLDFYRARNDAGISLLAKIDGLHEQTITTCQVEMEFKKNRQKAISESVSLLKPPDFNLTIPAFLADAATVKVIKDQIQDAKKRVEKLKGRILSTLEKPKTHDRIYQTIQRLFNNPSKLNLRHQTPDYKVVWRRALRRFLEGRPPRKKEDTSAGDAINWEWIIRCIETTNRDVIIVSRDADYGLTLEGKGYANNWLSDEVKTRVNKRRKLILVDRLSAALKLLDVEVTREEVISERATIKPVASAHESEVEGLVEEALHDLLNSEEMSSLIAQTNTSGWACDQFEVGTVEVSDGIWTVQVFFSFSGEQDEDKPWSGNTISGNCVMEIDREKKVTFSELEADVERDEDHESEEDESEEDGSEEDESEEDESEEDESEEGKAS
jgi:PIN domain